MPSMASVAGASLWQPGKTGANSPAKAQIAIVKIRCFDSVYVICAVKLRILYDFCKNTANTVQVFTAVAHFLQFALWRIPLPKKQHGKSLLQHMQEKHIHRQSLFVALVPRRHPDGWRHQFDIPGLLHRYRGQKMQRVRRRGLLQGEAGNGWAIKKPFKANASKGKTI